jgi:hypothetical protein
MEPDLWKTYPLIRYGLILFPVGETGINYGMTGRTGTTGQNGMTGVISIGNMTVDMIRTTATIRIMGASIRSNKIQLPI